MKTIYRTISTFILILVCVSQMFSATINVYSPEGRVYSFNERTESQYVATRTSQTAQFIRDNGLSAKVIGNASDLYNCHGYAYIKSEEIKDTCWINTTSNIFASDQSWANDNLPSYITTSESNATHTFYPNCIEKHSTRKIQNSYPVSIDYTTFDGDTLDYVSKWGFWALVQHKKNHDRYYMKSDLGQDYYILKKNHYGTLSSYPKTWIGASGITHNITDDLTVPSGVTLTIKEDATVQFTSGKDLTINGTLVLNDDLTIPSGSILTFNSGSSVTFASGVNLTVNGTLVMGEDLTIPTGSTLTFNSNSEAKFSSSQKLYINGTLDVNGSSGSEVTFTRSAASGTWGGIQFNSGSTGDMEYANITYGYSGVKILSPNVTLTNCDVTNFSNIGIYSYFSSPPADKPVIEDCLVDWGGGVDYKYGILVESTNPKITGTTINDAEWGLRTYQSTAKCENGLNSLMIINMEYTQITHR